jgi:hypothetical protein
MSNTRHLLVQLQFDDVGGVVLLPEELVQL